MASRANSAFTNILLLCLPSMGKLATALWKPVQLPVHLFGAGERQDISQVREITPLLLHPNLWR